MPELDPPLAATRMRRRRWLLRGAIALLVVAIAGGAIGYFIADDLIERRLRPATIELLESRFNSDVTLDTLDVQVFPRLGIRGGGLTLRLRGRNDIPPLIAVRAFTIEAGIRELWIRHIDRVHLQGLEIMIPPRRGEDMPTIAGSGESSGGPNAYIHELLTEDGLLTIMPRHGGKRPRVFQLRRIRFEEFQFADPTPFEASLTNPIPAGEIAVVGQFGPWQREEPSLTPVTGTFIFDADLGTIKGIGGALHAEGQFGGPLERIQSSGRTRTEGFHLSTGGARFPLRADYTAIVDGTDGDTYLDKVDADLNGSKITARGAIEHVEGVTGRRIRLETITSGGSLDDFIKLTTRVPTSPMTGRVDVRATIAIPPGEADVIDKLDLDGVFEVSAARFTSKTIQARVDELARRGSGRPADRSIDDVVSNLRGSFRLRNARMTLRSLTFRVQGAEVRLAGSYDTRTETLDFNGELRLQARASRTQTGWRSLVLRIFDPMLDGKGAGTVLPISITGTREAPKFGVDFRKALLH